MRIWIAFLLLMIHLIVELGKNDVTSAFVCGADILVGQLGPFSFLWGVILPIILINQRIVKYNFRYQYVIRGGSWKSILFNQIKKITLASVLISITYIVFVILYCKLNGIVLYNWDSYESLFNLYTQQKLEASGSNVYIYAFMCIFMRCIVINHILLLFFWGCRHEIMGVLVILCLIFDEAIRGGKWICRLFVFDYRIWCENSERFYLIAQATIYVIVVVAIYRYLLLRKEMLLCE